MPSKQLQYVVGVPNYLSGTEYVRKVWPNGVANFTVHLNLAKRYKSKAGAKRAAQKLNAKYQTESFTVLMAIL